MEKPHKFHVVLKPAQSRALAKLQAHLSKQRGSAIPATQVVREAITFYAESQKEKASA